jgi:hypothetical protein
MEFYTKYYNQLIDYVVTGVEFDTDGFVGPPFPCTADDAPFGRDRARRCDEEGNPLTKRATALGFCFVEEAK